MPVTGTPFESVATLAASVIVPLLMRCVVCVRHVHVARTVHRHAVRDS